MDGGVGIVASTGRHMCRQYRWLLTYSCLRGWNWITTSSSSQNRLLTRHISSQVGQRVTVDTLTCSHPSPSEAIMFSASGRLGFRGTTKQPLLPKLSSLVSSGCGGKLRRRYLFGTWKLTPGTPAPSAAPAIVQVCRACQRQTPA